MNSFGTELIQQNPWSSSESQIKKAYNLSRKYRVTVRVGEGDDKVLHNPRDDSLSPSIRHIRLLEERSQIKRKLQELDLDIEKRMLDRETKDIIYSSLLEKKIKVIQSLNNHLQCVIDSKTQLITRLQQPFVGDYIKLEAQYHRFASELFPQIATMMADFNNHLENITWNKSLSFADGKLDEILMELNALLASHQTHFTTMLKVRENMDRLYEASVDS